MNNIEKFIQEINKPENTWWDIIRNDKDFRIDLRRMANKNSYPQINVYYRAGSFMKIYYTRSGFRASIKQKYIDGNKKSNAYKKCPLEGRLIKIDDYYYDLGTSDIKNLICKNILVFYDKMERTFEANYSADTNNNILITEYTGENKDRDELRYKDENGNNINNIRIDMVRVNPNNVVDLIELKLDKNNEIKKNHEKHKRNIKNQSNIYKNYCTERPYIIEKLQEHYSICEKLKLPCAKYRPEKINSKITIMIACKNGDKSFMDDFLLQDEIVNEAVNIEVIDLDKYYNKVL